MKVNTPSTTVQVRYGGVILFDGNGLLVSKRFGFRLIDANNKYTQLGALLLNTLQGDPAKPGDADIAPTLNPATLRSQFGLILFDQQTFDNRGFSLGDAQITGAAYSAGELGKESWLDENATSVLINRYNGTLVKGE